MTPGPSRSVIGRKQWPCIIQIHNKLKYNTIQNRKKKTISIMDSYKWFLQNGSEIQILSNLCYRLPLNNYHLSTKTTLDSSHQKILYIMHLWKETTCALRSQNSQNPSQMHIYPEDHSSKVYHTCGDTTFKFAHPSLEVKVPFSPSTLEVFLTWIWTPRSFF